MQQYTNAWAEKFNKPRDTWAIEYLVNDNRQTHKKY